MVILRAKCIVAGMYVLFLLIVFTFVKYLGKFSCKIINVYVAVATSNNNDCTSFDFVNRPVLNAYLKLFNTVI